MDLFLKNVLSVQIVNCVFKYLFYLLFVCILIFSTYPKQLFPLHIGLTFYVFIALFPVYFIDNIDVTINKRASILQTLGSLSAHCSSRDGVARGEASRGAPVPVPVESVCDDSQVPSHGPLWRQPLLFDLIVAMSFSLCFFVIAK